VSRKKGPEPSLALEVAAALLVPAGAFGFVRVFSEVSSVLPLVGASLMSTALAVALRRLNVPLFVAFLVSLGGLALLMINRYAPGTATAGVVPNGETINELGLLLDDGLEQFRRRRAPVEAVPPFIAATMIGTWVMAFLTDWGAQRLRLAFEPVLPSSLLFIFSAVLGAGDRRLVSTLVFAATVVVWAVTQRAQHLSEQSTWLSSDKQRGPVGMAQRMAAVSVLALLAGTLIGPRLPGAGEEELYYWRNRTDPTRVVVSPFVEIGSRLVEQKDIDLFRVKADRPAYWRLAGLDTYDERGASWSTTLKFQATAGDLPGLAPTLGSTSVLRQEVEIQKLGTIWLPAAFAPAKVVEASDGVIWNEETASLAISDDKDRADDNSDGLVYAIESVIQRYTVDELNQASEFVPPEIQERFLTLPTTLSPQVASLALEITANATTRYEQSLALQNYFREFDYSLSLTRREGDPIEQFLRERVGFCQQFSGTFALMARSLGIPTRVAVGFTWGDPVEGEPGVYQVTGRHTHAWPEVWFEGLGWVAFEPTPGRGAPDAGYTGLQEQQDSLVQANFEQLPTTPTTQPPDTDTTIDPNFADELDDIGLGDLGGGAAGGSQRGYGPPWLAATATLAVAAYAAGMPLLFRIRRARRHRSATTAAAKIEAVWADTADDLQLRFGLVRRPSETRSEFADRISDDSRVSDRALSRLAKAVSVARYGSTEAAAAQLSTAEEAGAEVQGNVSRRTSRWQRWRLVSSPRRLLRMSERRVL